MAVFVRGPVRRGKKSYPTPLCSMQHCLTVTALALSARGLDYHLQFANCFSKTFSAKFANCVLDHFQQIVIPNHIFANCHSEPFPWTLFIICSVISQIVILDYFANLAESFWISFCKLSFRVIFLLLLTVVADHFFANLAKCWVAKSAK